MSDESAAPSRLEQTWQLARGFPGALAEVNNQPIGKRYMITALVFFLLGGVEALLMRAQLAVSNNDFMGPQTYNQLFTMHGSTMMFLFAVPFLEGLGLYLLPLMIGSRDVAFPRLSAYGYWLYLFGGIVFYASFLFGAVPDIGWFGYTPLSTSRFTGMATDFWLLGLSLVEVAGLTAAVELVATILKFRAPGMTLARMPLFVWTLLAASLMILVAFSVLLTATMLLELDRAAGTHFYSVHRGGSNLLWQHLFWFFGHPEVYIMFLPATGIISMVVTVAARRPTVGYTLIVVAVVVMAFVSFGLWVHHMFTAGLPELSKAFFTAASLLIAIASGIQVFAWIATLWGSAPRFTTPLLFALGFLFTFVLGGMTGVMVAVVPFDIQVHDSYFVVAHFHYVLIGGVLFPIFAGLHHWLPLMTGRHYSERLGHWSFWLTFIGFNVTFFPMHIMGFLGLPRRVYTYSPELQIDEYNLVSTAGVIALAAGTAVFLLNVAVSLRYGGEAGGNPWDADTLEWSTGSPVPDYSFLAIPSVDNRHPLWAERPPSAPDETTIRALAAMAGEPQSWRAALATDPINANPQAIQHLPGLTFVPLWAALGTVTAAVGVLAKAYILAAFGALAAVVAVVLWLTPQQSELELRRESDLGERAGLTLFPTGAASTVWWGMVGLMTILGSSFGALVYSYFYIRLFSSAWPQENLPLPDWKLPAAALAALFLSAAVLGWGLRTFRRRLVWRARLALAGAGALGAAFAGLYVFELGKQGFGWRTNAYTSLFFVISAAMLLLAAVGLALQLATFVRLGQDPPERASDATLQFEIAVMYWIFTAVMGLIVFATLFLSPQLFASQL